MAGRTHPASWISVAAFAWLASCSAGDGPEGGGRVPVVRSQAGGGGAAGSTGVGGFGTGPSPGAGSGGAVATAGTGAGGGSAGNAPPMREVVVIDQCGAGNPAGLSDAQVEALVAGGSSGAMRWLYPYDGTVFPRGMLAPTLMWDGAEGSVVYVRIHASLFDYRGCLQTTGPQQLELPQDVWRQAGDQSAGPSDPFTIELTVQGASGAVGPIREQIVIAQATLKGSIYYNSYVSTTGAGQGAVYRIPPGAQAQEFLGGNGCYGCHAVSANGERMISHFGIDPGASYALAPDTQPNPPVLAATPGAAFSGLSPDGSLYVASAHPAGLVRPQGTPFEALLVNDAALFATDTGAEVAGSGIPLGAMMPMFSPDGRLLAFNDFAENMGRGLAVVDFDATTRTASNRRVVFTDSAEYPGWPFILPDNKAVVFARGTNSQFSGAGAGVLAGLMFAAPESDLYIVDIDSGTSTLLALAMGLSTPQDTTGYVPFGADDLHKHYYPTVSPVAAGGYYWLFFDSIRNYGNNGVSRQLWGSALTIAADGVYAADPSHPAFYVTGQDPATGNHRAFTALDPCRQDGESCETGIDCCNGFCTDGVCGKTDEPRCSNADEVCATREDCCNPADLCLNGFCGRIIGPD